MQFVSFFSRQGNVDENWPQGRETKTIRKITVCCTRGYRWSMKSDFLSSLTRFQSHI
jgi:hypothetical protein